MAYNPNVRGFHSLGPARNQYRQADPNAEGPVEATSMFQGRPGLPGPNGMVLQPLGERLFPWHHWKTMTCFMSCLQALMFVISLIVGGAKFDGAFVKGNEMLGPSSITLKYMGGKWEPSIRDGEIWRLVTPILLHGGILHIASNLFFQLRFGFVLERRWGWRRWLMLYIATGIGASFFSAVQSPGSVSVGASGALFGLVGLDFAYMAMNWHDLPHVKMEMCIMSMVTLINLLLGMGNNIDNWAHFGGLVTGIFIGPCTLPFIQPKDREALIRSVSFAATLGLLLLFSCLLWVDNPGGNS